MDLIGLRKIIVKLNLLNSNRMEHVRNSFTTTREDKADYEDRFKEQEWYNQVIGEIDQQLLGRDLEKLTLTRDELQVKIQEKLESRYDEVLEKTRQKGAGTMTEERKPTYAFSTPTPEEGDGNFTKGWKARMEEVEGDYKFLESCGIKKEIW